MIKKKKVGVITMHRVLNYGSFLQSYATQQVIDKLGFNCELIDYVFPNKWHKENGLISNITLKSFIHNALPNIGLTATQRKKKHFKRAINKYYKLSNNKYKHPKELIDNPPIYDVYVTGSDQTWNVKHTQGDDAFLLAFAPEKAKKISFSASLAGSNMDKKHKNTFKHYLERYNAISIRDRKGNLIINELVGKDAEITLDPTLLLNRDEWSEFGANKKNLYKNQDYILFYLITHSFDPTPYIYEVLKQLQTKTGLKVFSFTHIPKEFGINYSFCGDVSLEKFIQLFESAYYAVTSSFHGTAFSVNFGIPLYSIVSGVKPEDDRQSSFLKDVGLDNCIVPIGKEFKDIDPLYSKEDISDNLQELRLKSIDYLKTNL